MKGNLEKLVISAARSKDVVACNPEVLAEIVLGERSCRFGLSPKARLLSMEKVHTLVLWTKSPQGILLSQKLEEALKKLRNSGVLLVLQLGVTGFGSTFVEMGVAPWWESLNGCRELIERNVFRADAVVLRYDPLLSLSFLNRELSNCREDLFEKIVKRASSLGIERCVTSACDLDSYRRAAERFEKLGILHTGPSDDFARAFIGSMAEIAHSSGMELSVCCNPDMEVDGFGCIDGRLYNSLSKRAFGRGAPECSELRHNAVASQRPRCKCSFSRDIAYSKGFQYCYGKGMGCLYCYSQARGISRLAEPVRAEMQRLSKDRQAWEREPYAGLLLSD